MTKGDDVPMLSQSVGTNNRISGYCYDAAGNLLAQSAPPCPSPTYTYDAENRMTATAGVTYTYDGDGRRVKKSNGKLYWYGPGLDILVETDLSGDNPTEFVVFNGKRVARRDSTGVVSYFFADHLGSARVVTSSSGVAVEESDYYPFGGERVILDGLNDQYKFTGKERDPESSLDYFGVRYYLSALGRFMTIDPVTGDVFNPQRLNLYAYVLNNPLAYVDPDGLQEMGASVFDLGRITAVGWNQRGQHFDAAAVLQAGLGTATTRVGTGKWNKTVGRGQSSFIMPRESHEPGECIPFCTYTYVQKTVSIRIKLTFSIGEGGEVTANIYGEIDSSATWIGPSPTPTRTEVTNLAGGMGFIPKYYPFIDSSALRYLKDNQLNALLNTAASRPNDPIYRAIYNAALEELQRREKEKGKSKDKDEAPNSQKP